MIIQTIKVMKLKRNCLFIMKCSFITIAASITLTSMCWAKETVAQKILEHKVFVTIENKSLAEAFKMIEKKVKINFIYSSAIDYQQKISLPPRKEKLKDLLDRLLTPLNLSYKATEETIIVLNIKDQTTSEDSSDQATESGNNAANNKPDEITIQGRVVNQSNGEPLSGVSISIKGSNIGTTTDSVGFFNIKVPEPRTTLIISSVGFEKLELTAESISANTNILLKPAFGNMSDVVVIGSRSSKPRTDVSRPVPVDVMSAKDLQATGQIDLGQMLQFTSPSFNSAKTGINGVANFADPATLRGLSPDQSLVLVNGKRRHQFSAINNNVTIGKGTVVTDLNSIPSLAIDRLEIMRDGAAAQYGSDAIAGIVNLALKKTVNSGFVKIQYGAHKEGDGANFLAALNYGFKLGKEKSYFNFTLHYQNAKGTDRSDPFTGKIYRNTQAQEDSVRAARKAWPLTGPFKVSKYGSNENTAYQAFINTGYPLNNKWSLYAFGGVSKKNIIAHGFFRNAIPTDANSNPAIFPDGYAPVLPGKTLDYSVVTGINKTVTAGWNMDFSTGYGFNYLDLFAKNTTNPSMGSASPTNFYVGRSSFGQSTTELNFSKNYEGLWGTDAFNLAFGTQFRIDNFKLGAGDSASYIAGPLATSNGKAPGSSGRPGIAKTDETNESRTNIGVYADVETDITKNFLVAAALRYENYSDFGSNISGKLATRLNFSKSIAIRGSVNKGFRAPSLQQIFNSQTTSTAQAGQIRQTKQLPSNDARLQKIGIGNPKAETSWNYNVGITAKAGNGFLFTIDAYQIDIADRIIISEQLVVGPAIPALVPLFPGIREITFFTNHINTKTRGIDLVTIFRHNFKSNNNITASVAFTFNKTEISKIKVTPAELSAGAPNPSAIKIIDTISIALIESAQPGNKVLVSVAYQLGKLNISTKATYFGEVEAWEKPAGLAHRSQTFSGKTLIDASLTYTINNKFSVTVGGNNLTDTYPDKVFSNYASYSSGQIPYTRNANQFGFNGAYYYSTLSLKF